MVEKISASTRNRIRAASLAGLSLTHWATGLLAVNKYDLPRGADSKVNFAIQKMNIGYLIIYLFCYFFITVIIIILSLSWLLLLLTLSIFMQ